MSAISVLETPLAPSARTPDEEPYFEILDGEKVELPLMSAYASVLASRLTNRVGAFAQDNIGQAVCEVLFRFPSPKERNRRPDAALVCYERWPKTRRIPWSDNAWDVVPDLAIEVLSPNDLAEDLFAKLSEYFQVGVRLVWVVSPLQQWIYVYESINKVRILTREDDLEGGEVLPGFRLPLAELFNETIVTT
jgi:Uma2 family endonuclease